MKIMRKIISVLIILGIYWPGTYIWYLVKPEGYSFNWSWYVMPVFGTICLVTIALIIFAVFLYDDYFFKK